MVHVSDTGSTATTYTGTNVATGVRHVYRVKAINSAGLGPVSNYVRATPQKYRSGGKRPLLTPVQQAKTQLLTSTFQLRTRTNAKKRQDHNSKPKNNKKRKATKDPQLKRPPRGPEDRKAYEKARGQTLERKEYRRQLRQKQLQTAKETGKCRDCPNAAIPGQRSCEICAEKHRIRRRKNDDDRRARARAKAERQLNGRD